MAARAQARCDLGLFRSAVAAGRKGESLADRGTALEFRDLLDEVARVAALHGSMAGFDGRLLEVRTFLIPYRPRCKRARPEAL